MRTRRLTPVQLSMSTCEYDGPNYVDEPADVLGDAGYNDQNPMFTDADLDDAARALRSWPPVTSAAVEPARDSNLMPRVFDEIAI